MITLLLLAVVVGMHHALETDHVAAVSSLISGRKSIGEMVRHGVTWGLGHTLTLFIFSAGAMAFGQQIPDNLANLLEGVVGVMLVGLGLHVLWRVWRDRVHFHSHSHADGERHFHVHSHLRTPKHNGEPMQHRYVLHDHEHQFSWRTLLVGMTHGMAGSAALLVLAVSQINSVAYGLAYVLLFGVGSMFGMALVTAVLSVPLTLTARFMTNANRALQLTAGLVTVAVGLTTLGSLTSFAFVRFWV